ncbi:uncharacterized protein [Antedon mediterranea]|uniref:uncharacterized protein n=1 Tax=Antedon mediterranea TaxID=105859 RepID=UPI003AF81AAF
MESDFKQTDQQESVYIGKPLSNLSGKSSESPSSAGSHKNRNLLRCYHDLTMHLFNTGHEREVENLFIAAARDGQYDRVENFLQRRTHEIVNIDVKDSITGNTPLIWAAKHGHEKIVHLLLKYGADVTLSNFEHQTAIEVAPANLRKLLIGSVDRTGSSPRHLLQAAWQGNLKAVQKLLSESRVLDINCRNADSLTPLLLVTRDVDLFFKLGDAMKNYNPEAVIVELLLNRADANASDNEGRTALHYAASLKCNLAEKVTLSLLQDGSLVEARDNRCITPMHSASQNGQVEVLLALLANGADVNTRGYAGTTPLHVSAQANQLQSVNTLLNRGADVTLVDDRGFTPVDVARNKKMKSTLKDAWMEATSNKPEMTVLSPVKPPSRASLNHMSIDDRTPRLLSIDGTTHGSERVNILQKMTEAHKALKVEEQILKDLDAGLFSPELTSKKLKTPIPPRTPRSDKTSSPNNPTSLLERPKVKRTLVLDGKVKAETERGNSAGSTKGHQKLAQRLSDPARRTDMVDYSQIPVTVVGLDLDDNIEDIRFHRLLHCPINGIIERQKKRCSLPEVTPLPYRSNVTRRKSTPNKPIVSEVLDAVDELPRQGCITAASPLHDVGKQYPLSRTVLPPSPNIHLDTQNIRQETIFEYDSGNEECISERINNSKPSSGNHLTITRAGGLMHHKRTFNIEMSRVKSSADSDHCSSQSSMSCSSISSFSTSSPHDSPRGESKTKDCPSTTNRMGAKMTPAATVTQNMSCNSESIEITDVEKAGECLTESDQDSGVVSSSSSPPVKRSNTTKAPKVLLREVSEDFTAKVFPVNFDTNPNKEAIEKPLNDVVRVNFITSSQPLKTLTEKDSSTINRNNLKNSEKAVLVDKVDKTKPSKQSKPPSRVSTSAKPSLLLPSSDKDCPKICTRTFKSAGTGKQPATKNVVENKLETLKNGKVNTTQNSAAELISTDKEKLSATSTSENVVKDNHLSTQQNSYRVTQSAKPNLGQNLEKDSIKNRTFSKSADVVKQVGNSNNINNKLETLNPVPVMSKTSPITKTSSSMNSSPKLSNGTPSVSKSFSRSAKQIPPSVKIKEDSESPIESKEKNKPELGGLISATTAPLKDNIKHATSLKEKTDKQDKLNYTLKDNKENVNKELTNTSEISEIMQGRAIKANVKLTIAHSTNDAEKNNVKQQNDSNITNKEVSIETLENQKTLDSNITKQSVINSSVKSVIQKEATPKPHIMGKKVKMQDKPCEKLRTDNTATNGKLTPRIPSAPKPTGPGRPKYHYKSPDTSPRVKDEKSENDKEKQNADKSGKNIKVHNTPVICDMFETLKRVEQPKGVKIIPQNTDRKKATIKQNVRNNSGNQKRKSQSATKEKSLKESGKVLIKSNSTVSKKKKITKEKPDNAAKNKGKSKTTVKYEKKETKKPLKKVKKKSDDTMIVKDSDIDTTAFISGKGWHIKTKKNESDNVIIHNHSLKDDLSDSDDGVKLSPHSTLKLQEMVKMRSMTQEQVSNLVNVMSPFEANTPRYIPNTMGTIKQFFVNACKDNNGTEYYVDDNELPNTRQFSFEEKEMKTICEVKEREILMRKRGNKDIVEGPVNELSSNNLPSSEVENLSIVSESTYETNPEFLKVFKIPDHVDNEEEEEPNASDVEEIEVEPVTFIEEVVKENADNSIDEGSDRKCNQVDDKIPDSRTSSAKSNGKSAVKNNFEDNLANLPPLPSYQPKKLPKSAFKKRHSEPVMNPSQENYDELNQEYFDERVKTNSNRGQSAKCNESKKETNCNSHLENDFTNKTDIDKRSKFSILDKRNEDKNLGDSNVVRNLSESVFEDERHSNVQQPPNDRYLNVVEGTDSSPPVKLQRPSEDTDSLSDEDDLLGESLAQSVMSDILEKTFSEASRAGSSWSADSVTRTSILGKGRSHSSRVSSSDRSQSSSTTVSEPEEELLHWKKGNILGKGAFGKVYCGLTNTGQLIAVKQVELSERDKVKSENQYEKLQEEVELLKNLRHKHIVGFLGVSLEDDTVNIFMQFIPGGSIASLLARFGALDEPVFCRYTKQILEGIEYLHTNNVIHRDIKGANIMLMSNGVIKLIDFGCAKRLCINLSQSQSLLTSMRGTPYWMAPEVIMETGYGTKSDIWSIGCTVFEMATRKPPWAEMPPMTAIYYIGSGSGAVPQLPDQFSKEARSFVRICLSRDQHERPTASSLLKHAFIRRRKERGRDRFSTRISSSTFEEGNINFKEKPKSDGATDKNAKKPIYDFS